MDDRFDTSSLLAEYREEARQQLDFLDRYLLRVESGESPTGEQRTELLRVLHTLKGNSAMMGLKPIAGQLHALETVFRGGSTPPRHHLDSLFELSATLRSAIDRLGGKEQEDALARVAALRLPDGLLAAGAEDGPPSTPAHEETGAAAEADAEMEDAEEEAEEADRSPRAAPAAGAVPIPTGVAPPPVKGQADGAPLADAPSDAGARSAASDGEGEFPTSADDVLRVPFGKLDALLAQVGELVSVHGALETLVEDNRAALAGAGLYREISERLEDFIEEAAALRETTMELRLVPVRSVFGRFPALVRELARAQGKRARMVLEGEAIELDKSLVDALGEPLLHLVRNAVDHGIESPRERERLGKPAEATIALRAARAGDRVRIEVSDDGAGIDRVAILRRARELGLLAAGEEPADDRDLFDLMLAPGFSTRAEVTHVSGRGMGLDIVRRRVTRLRGSLRGEPGPGGGTAFTLELPLTLAIVPALIFDSEGERLAIPTLEVTRTLSGTPMERVGGADVIRFGDGMVPLARPSRIFGWSRPEVVRPADGDVPRVSPFAIVIGSGSRAAAVEADRLVDQRDVVVKALPAYLGPLPGISGATVAPDGQVILLLDGGALLDLNVDSHRRR